MPGLIQKGLGRQRDGQLSCKHLMYHRWFKSFLQLLAVFPRWVLIFISYYQLLVIGNKWPADYPYHRAITHRLSLKIICTAWGCTDSHLHLQLKLNLPLILATCLLRWSSLSKGIHRLNQNHMKTYTSIVTWYFYLWLSKWALIKSYAYTHTHTHMHIYIYIYKKIITV